MFDIDDARNADDNERWDRFHDDHAIEDDLGDRCDRAYEWHVINEEICWRKLQIANGIEPDGIKYKCYLEIPYWIVNITDIEGNIFTEKFHWQHEPRCGPDIAAVQKAEEIMDRLIYELRR